MHLHSLIITTARERLRASFLSLFLLVALLVLLASGAHAQAITRIATIRVLGAANSTANSTFATTSYADLPAATLSFQPARDPNMACAPGEVCPIPHLHVWVNLDVTKATTLTGTCAIFANGAVIAASARTVDIAAKESTMSLFTDVAESVTYTGTPLVIKVQCKSADTAVLTVAFGVLYAEEVY